MKGYGPDDVAVAPVPAGLLPLLVKPAVTLDTMIGVPVAAEGDGVTIEYGAAALAGECARIITASVGQRNHALNRGAYSIGSLVAGGAIDEGLAWKELTAAGLSAGLDAEEVRATIHSGLKAGARHPRKGPQTTRVSDEMLDLDDRDLRVLLAVRLCSNRAGLCRARLEALAAKARLSEKSVTRSLDTLVAAGWLKHLGNRRYLTGLECPFVTSANLAAPTLKSGTELSPIVTTTPVLSTLLHEPSETPPAAPTSADTLGALETGASRNELVGVGHG